PSNSTVGRGAARRPSWDVALFREGKGDGSACHLPNGRGDRYTRVMRIVAAMSGGVDSSVAAALLREQGHDVVGISMQLHDQTEGKGPSFGRCFALDDIHDAKAVAARRGIPDYVLVRVGAIQVGDI